MKLCLRVSDLWVEVPVMKKMKFLKVRQAAAKIAVVCTAVVCVAILLPVNASAEPEVPDVSKGRSMIEVATAQIPEEIVDTIRTTFREETFVCSPNCKVKDHALNGQAMFIRYYQLDDFSARYLEGLPPKELAAKYSIDDRTPPNKNRQNIGGFFTINEKNEVIFFYMWYDLDAEEYVVYCMGYWVNASDRLFDFLMSEAVLPTEQGAVPVNDLSVFPWESNLVYCETDAGVYVQSIVPTDFRLFMETADSPWNSGWDRLFTLEDFTGRMNAYYNRNETEKNDRQNILFPVIIVVSLLVGILTFQVFPWESAKKIIQGNFRRKTVNL